MTRAPHAGGKGGGGTINASHNYKVDSQLNYRSRTSNLGLGELGDIAGQYGAYQHMLAHSQPGILWKAPLHRWLISHKQLGGLGKGPMFGVPGFELEALCSVLRTL